MNVLHLTLSYSNGGRREAIAALAQGLRDLGVGSYLGCLDEFGSEPVERDLFNGSFSLERNGMLDLVALRRLAAYCRAHAIDVVHAHDAASEAMASLRSEEHTSELQSLMRTSYAVFCLKKNIFTVFIVT